MNLFNFYRVDSKLSDLVEVINDKKEKIQSINLDIEETEKRMPNIEELTKNKNII